MEEHDIRQRLQQQRYDEAFDLLVERAKDKVFRLSVSMLNNETQAQDLTQEVLIKIWKALPRYSGAASLSTWIYAITRNTCLTELKKRNAHPTVSLSAPEMDGLDPAAADHAQAGAETDVETLLARLPERYRRVVTLFYLEQKSYDEVAAMLEMPLGTVKTMLFRGRKELLRLGEKRTVIPSEPAQLISS
jgi:RNA polymerase sigma-70 factor (ECF subfamily)